MYGSSSISASAAALNGIATLYKTYFANVQQSHGSTLTTATVADDDLRTSKRRRIPVGWRPVRLGRAGARAAWVARRPVIDGPERVVDRRPLAGSIAACVAATHVASNKPVDKVKTWRRASYAIVPLSFPRDLPATGRTTISPDLTNNRGNMRHPLQPLKPLNLPRILTRYLKSHRLTYQGRRVPLKGGTQTPPPPLPCLRRHFH